MFAKVEIVGTLEVVTGLHIGGNSAFAAIGAVDAPVITDVRSGDPIIPGSSLKGKCGHFWQSSTTKMLLQSRMMTQNV